jgi:Family of unknown function (DUF6152)
MRTTRRIMAIAAGVLLSLGVQPVQAHHSYAPFDKSRVVSVQGTVTRWDWTNPHSFLYLAVRGPGRATTEWEIESASPSLLQRIGFSATAIKPGDRVTVRLYPHRSRARFGALVAVDLPSGRTLVVSLLDPKAR